MSQRLTRNMKDVMQWRLRSGSALLYQSRTRDGSTLVVQIQYLTKRRVIDNPPLRSISTSHSLTSFPANKLITNKSTFRPKLARSSGSIANLSVVGWRFEGPVQRFFGGSERRKRLPGLTPVAVPGFFHAEKNVLPQSILQCTPLWLSYFLSIAREIAAS